MSTIAGNFRSWALTAGFMLFAAASSGAAAQGAAAAPEEVAVAAPEMVAVPLQPNGEAGAEKLDPDEPNSMGTFGFSFGVGVSFLGRDDVKATQLENNIVRITDSEEQQRSAWLVTQYLFDKNALLKNRKYVTHGPFFALQAAGSGGPFDAAAIGYMISMKRKELANVSDKAALNFGLGFFSGKVSQLGAGITENETLPEGIESIRMRKKDTNGIVLIVSFSVL